MNERVEKYLNLKKEEQRKRQAAYRDKVLVAAGLYERQYVPKEEGDDTDKGVYPINKLAHQGELCVCSVKFQISHRLSSLYRQLL